MIRVGDTIHLREDFHIVAFDTKNQIVDCKMFIREGDRVEAMEFKLLTWTPCFRVGPYPHTFLHPTHLTPDHPHFCVYISEVSSTVYLPNLKKKGNLYLPDSFYFDGIFRLVISAGNRSETEYLPSISADHNYAKRVFSKLLESRTLISGQLVNPKVVKIWIGDTEVEYLHFSKIANKKGIVVLLAFSKYVQMTMDYKLFEWK